MSIVQRLVVVGACLVMALPASAQEQSKAQQKCLNGVAKKALKVSSTVVNEGARCVLKGALGKLPGTTAACIADDAGKKRVKARAKVGDTIARSCGTPPSFGFTDETTINDAHESEAEATFVDEFGADVDATLAASSGVDPKGRCSQGYPKRLRKISDAMQKVWGRCLKDGLRDGSITDLSGLDGCLDDITADLKGRIGKQADKLGLTVGKKCSQPDLSTIFPGLDVVCTAYGEPITPTGLGACAELRSRCRVCRTLERAHGFVRGCDEFDNGVVDGTCPECPNGVVDAGEQCDDGNMVDGDGCTADCVDEFCGDGVINDGGAEQCDDGVGNSDVTPDACRSDCSLPSCGDAVTDSGEECDDGNLDDTDGCTSACTICGNGVVTAPEACDDGNLDDGDCCKNDCTVALDGTPCPAIDECVFTAECVTGVCAPITQVVSGDACPFAVVGEADADTDIRTEGQATVDGPWCGSQGDFGQSSVFRGNGDIVLTEDDGGGVAAVFGASVDVDSGDIVANLADIVGRNGVDVPGLAATDLVASGSVVAKTPAPTFYDTTGTDPRVQLCIDAQASLDAMATQLDGLTVTQNLGATYDGITGGTTLSLPPVPATVVAGGLNVYDLTEISGGNDVIINIHGGNDPDTVVVVRVAGRIDSDQRWTFNLVDDLQASNVLFYGKSTAQFRCELGEDNVFSGTLFCPDTRTDVKLRTVVNGAVFGGGGGGTGRLMLGELTELNHVAFTGL